MPLVTLRVFDRKKCAHRLDLLLRNAIDFEKAFDLVETLHLLTGFDDIFGMGAEWGKQAKRIGALAVLILIGKRKLGQAWAEVFTSGVFDQSVSGGAVEVRTVRNHRPDCIGPSLLGLP